MNERFFLSSCFLSLDQSHYTSWTVNQSMMRAHVVYTKLQWQHRTNTRKQEQLNGTFKLFASLLHIILPIMKSWISTIRCFNVTCNSVCKQRGHAQQVYTSVMTVYYICSSTNLPYTNTNTKDFQRTPSAAFCRYTHRAFLLNSQLNQAFWSLLLLSIDHFDSRMVLFDQQ